MARMGKRTGGGVRMTAHAYDDYRDNKIESGLLYQDFIVDLMLQVLRFPVTTYSSRLYQTTVGEGPCGVEIKHDEKYATTKRLWIEVAEKARPRDGDYAPSGICRDDNSWLYIIGNYDVVFVFSKVLLRAYHDTGPRARKQHAHIKGVSVTRPDRVVLGGASIDAERGTENRAGGR